MEKYNKLLRNLTELIEKGLFTSKDLKKEVENSLKLKTEIIANKLNFVSREEFEVQKKLIAKIFCRYVHIIDRFSKITIFSKSKWSPL